MMRVTMQRHDTPSRSGITLCRHIAPSRSYGRTDGLTENLGFRDGKIFRYVTRARAGRISRFVTAAFVAIVALSAVACASNPAASCKQAVISQLTYEFSHPSAKAAGEPAACRGAPKATLLQYATEAMEQYAKSHPRRAS